MKAENKSLKYTIPQGKTLNISAIIFLFVVKVIYVNAKTCRFETGNKNKYYSAKEAKFRGWRVIGIEK